MSELQFTVEIEREDRWGPFAYSLFITPAPRFGGRVRFAWTFGQAQRKALRWITSAKRMGPKTDRDRVIVDQVTR